MVASRLTALLLHFFPLILLAQSPVKLTLRQCEDLALQNDPAVRLAELRAAHATARRTQAAHASILPKFEIKNVWGPISRARPLFNEFGVLSSPDTTFRFSNIRYYTEIELSLLQPLFTFGKLSNVKRAAQEGVEAEQAGLEASWEDTRLRVREAYWAVLLARELLQVIDEARSEVDKADQKIRDKLDEGAEDVSQTDLFKLQIFRYEVNKQHRKVTDDMSLAEAKLRMAVRLPESQGMELAAEYLDAVDVHIEDQEVYLEMAMRNRPELAQLAAGIRARSALVAAARSDYYPQFFIGGQVKYNYAPDRFDSRNPFVYNPTNFFRPGIVVGMSLNLNFVQTRDKVRVQQAEYEALSGKEPLLKQGIELEVRQAYLEVKRAQANLRESRRALRASENWLRSATMTFDIGVGEVKELIDAFKANGQMETEHLRNIYKLNVAVARLSRAVGKDLYPEE